MVLWTLGMVHSPDDTVVCVLAGGASRRMGRDKARIRIEGRAILTRVCDAAREARLPIIVVGRTGFGDRKLQAVRFIMDDTPGEGPLAALATALRQTPQYRNVLLCACDLPNLGAADFRWLVAKGAGLAQHSEATDTKTMDAFGVVPVWNGSPQPLFAIYSRLCLPLAEQLLADGRYAMRDLLNSAAFKLISLPAEHAAAVLDVDTDEDLKRITAGASPSVRQQPG